MSPTPHSERAGTNLTDEAVRAMDHDEFMAHFRAVLADDRESIARNTAALHDPPPDTTTGRVTATALFDPQLNAAPDKT